MIQAETALEAKVLALNLANERILKMLPGIVASLKPLVGQKVINQGNVISKKTRGILPSTDTLSPQIQVWYDASNYSLRINVKVACNYRNRQGEYHSCIYQEACATVGELDQFVLKAIPANGWEFRTDYTTQEVIKARVALRDAQKAVSAAESQLRQFGEYDTN